jgi:hypothetical protein
MEDARKGWKSAKVSSGPQRELCHKSSFHDLSFHDVIRGKPQPSNHVPRVDDKAGRLENCFVVQLVVLGAD